VSYVSSAAMSTSGQSAEAFGARFGARFGAGPPCNYEPAPRPASSSVSAGDVDLGAPFVVRATHLSIASW